MYKPNMIRTLIIGMAVVVAGGQTMQATDYLHSTLNNGLEVVVVEDNSAPLATAALFFKSGAFIQQEGQAGWSDLNRRLWFGVHEDESSSMPFPHVLSSANTIFDASTAIESQSIRFTTWSDSLDETLRLLLTAVQAPVIDDATVAVVKSAAVRDIKVSADNPDHHLRRAVEDLLWDSSLTQHDMAGSQNSISAADLDQLRLMQMRYIVPNNALLVISGAVTPKKAFKLAKAVFEPWATGHDPFASLPLANVDPLLVHRDTIIVRPVAAPKVVVAWKGPGLETDSRGAMAAQLLAEMLMLQTSKLKQACYSSGIILDVDIEFEMLRKVSSFTITLTTKNGETDTAYDLLLQVLSGYDSQSFAANDMNEAVLVIADKAFKQRSNPATLPAEFGSAWALADVEFANDYLLRLGEVDQAALRRVIRGYLLSRQHIVAVLANSRDQRIAAPDFDEVVE